MLLNSIKWSIPHRNVRAPYLSPDPKPAGVFKLLKKKKKKNQKSEEPAGFVSLTKVFLPIRGEETSEL